MENTKIWGSAHNMCLSKSVLILLQHNQTICMTVISNSLNTIGVWDNDPMVGKIYISLKLA